jgi:transcriptional regulator with XRE-family HTH domain
MCGELKDNIKKRRKEEGMNQKQLGDMINYSKSTVSNWEKGYSEPTSSQLKKLADIFDGSVDELLGIRKRKHHNSVGSSMGSAYSNSITYRKLYPTHYDYKDYALFINIILTPLVAYFPNDVFIAIVVLLWVLIASLKIIGFIILTQKEKESISYAPDQEVIYRMKNSTKKSLEALKKEAQNLFAINIFKFMATFLVAGLSFIILNNFVLFKTSADLKFVYMVQCQENRHFKLRVLP